MMRLLYGRMSASGIGRLPAILITVLGLLAPSPAHAVFRSVIEGKQAIGTNWVNGPLLGWNELDLIPLRTLHTGGPATNEVIVISFDHTKNVTIPGIQDLAFFTASSNVLITAGPTLSAPAGVDIWTYTFAITVTNSQPGTVEFRARMSAGSHLYPGASLNLSLPGPGQMQISKPSATAGTPDLALSKSGPNQASPGQLITYALSYTNKFSSPDTGNGVQVSDILPPEVTYVTNSSSRTVRATGNTLTWDLPNLAPGEFGLITYRVLVTTNIPITTTFANYAQIQSSQNDATPADNASSVTTTVVVTPAPVAHDDSYTTEKNQTLIVPAPGVLINDSNALSGIRFSGPNYGTLTFNTDGSFTYVPAIDFIGVDIFAYQAVNSTNISGPATVTINVISTCNFTVTTNLTVNNDAGLCGAVVNYPPPVTTGSCSPVICLPPSGSLFPVGTTTVTCTNADGISRSFEITVLDVEPPAIVCPSDLVRSNGPDQCSRSNVTYSVTFSDNCPGASLVQTAGLPSGSEFPEGTTTNSFTITDASGNTNSCSFTVTVRDAQVPTLTCPVDVTVNVDAGSCVATGVVLGSPVATDNCGTVTVSSNAPAQFPVGTNVVTWTAADANGNTATCQQRVIVSDNLAPVIACPANITRPNDAGICGAVVSWTAPVGTDNCPGASTAQTAGPASGSVFPIGTTTVTYTVTDAATNKTTCSFTVTVNDTQPPVIACPADVTVVAPHGQNSLVVDFAPIVNDNCPGATTNSSPASGSSFPLGTTTVTCIATDAAGNSANCSFTVTVRSGNNPPVADNQLVTTPQDTPVTITLTGSDLDGDALTFAIVSGPGSGVINGFDANAGTLQYTPSSGFIGNDSFTFRANDGYSDGAAATVTVMVAPQADVAVIKTGSRTGSAGTNISFTVTVTNLGPTTASNVVVFDQLPASYTFISSIPAPTSVVDNLVTWPTFNLAAHASSNFSIIVLPMKGGVFTNVSLATNDTPDPDLENNDGSWTNSRVTTFVQPLSDVAVFKTGPATVVAGGSINYTITVTNRGPLAATNTIVSDTLPAGATFSSASGNYTLSNGVVRWPASTLDKGSSATYTIAVVAPFTGVLTNVASATSDTPDPYPDNNDGTSPSSRVMTIVQSIADVAVLKAGPNYVTPGQIFAYTITVNNLGPVSAANVVVEDLLPAEVVFVSASGGGVLTGNTVTWPALAELASGATTSFTITATAPGSGQFTNVARASSSTLDPVPANNNGTAASSQVVTFVVPGEFTTVQGPNWLNPQTGLYEQRVTVTNRGSTTIAAFRLLVGDIRSTNGVPRTNVFLANATGTNTDGRPYVQYNAPLNPGSWVTLILEFRVPDRRPFTNSIEVLAVLPATTGTNSGSGVEIDHWFLDERFSEPRFVIEWTSVPGRTYTIIYSDTGITGPWHIATPTVKAASNRVQWYDDGPPKTISQPSSVSSRYYRVIELIANP